ncbi:MAG: Mov34/MPN/PAD-1 family protein [Promethearchaeota archaeon]|jgi:proteasome lid subunit RPN8/RPN11
MKKKKGVKPSYAPVRLSLKAYERIVGYAIRYANDGINPGKWREVYGILIGTVDNSSKVIIKDAIPIMVGDRAGVAFENKQYVDTAQIDASIYEHSTQDNKDEFIVGWWHTHPNMGFFYSAVDRTTQLGYQIPNPHAVGLIFDHSKRESDDNYLGIAGLRLKDPDFGMRSPFTLIELEYEFDQETMMKKANKVIKKVSKSMNKILKEIEFIDKVLRKKNLAQLQRNYGLILVPKEDIQITDSELEAEEDERFLYEWDPDIYKKTYRIPKFREKVENAISEAYDKLDSFPKEKETKDYEIQRQKLSKKIKSFLRKPNEWYDKLMIDFSKKIEIISSFFTYLDTNERKVIEYFEERSSEYCRVLDNLNARAELNLENI